MLNTITRRAFLRGASAASAAGVAIAVSPGLANAAIRVRHRRLFARPAPSPLNPARTLKYVNKLVNPLGDAPIQVLKPGPGATLTMSIQQTSQSLGLNTAYGLIKLPPTTVWGYKLKASSGVTVAANPATNVATYPGPTIEVMRGTKIDVTFENGLTGVGFPRNVPVDTTLDWANPGALNGTMPIPVATHLHGSKVYADAANAADGGLGKSDGGPLSWYTAAVGQPNQSGSMYMRTYTYENNQEAGFLWYHDHTLGITRTNVYMGLAGLYILRDANEQVLRTRQGSASGPTLPSYPYEVPLVIQDRMFQTDGSLFYPSSAYPDPAVVAPSPTHMPEFFGDVALVNTQAWPRLDVERRKYRLRFINGSDSRFYELSLQTLVGGRKLPIWVIGNELGLLNQPVRANLPVSPSATDGGSPNAGATDALLLAPADRYDVIVDFSQVPLGSIVILRNTASTPFPAGDPITPGMDQIMAFAVIKPLNRAVPDATINVTGTGAPTVLRGLAPDTPVLPDPGQIAVANTRKLFLFEGTDSFGRLMTMIGRVGPGPDSGNGTLTFRDPVTEKPLVGTSEIWEIYNTTVDAHPIHMHLVDFRILSRQPYTMTTADKPMPNGVTGAYLTEMEPSGPSRPAEPYEAGKKDTVIVYPGEVARVVATFDRPGDYVYHCHIISHEDHEMMRPFKVVTTPAASS